MLDAFIRWFFPKIQGRLYSIKTEPACGSQQFMDLQCKVALITGGTTGIGLAIANELLKHNLHKVIIGGIDPCEGESAAKRLSELHGYGKCCYMQMNINCPKQFEDVFNEATVKFGGVDILVNNAGILQDSRWDQEIDINMKASIRGTILAFQYMQKKKDKGGIVINNAALLALEPFPYLPVYSATKAGVVAATRCFGAKYHFDKTGVRVVALCPGLTDTPLLRNAGSYLLQKEWLMDATSALNPYPIQKPACCGRGVAYMVQFAEPGTVWAVDDAVLYRLNFPDSKDLCQEVLKL